VYRCLAWDGFFWGIAIALPFVGKEEVMHAPVGIAILLSDVICGALFAYYGYRHCRDSFRCYEHGVSFTNRDGERSLHDDEVVSFTYNGIDFYKFGLYTHTMVTFVFVPADRSKRISVTATVNRVDCDVDLINLRFSMIIGERIVARLLNNERVPWTKVMELGREVLHYKRPRFTWGADTVALPYAEVDRFEIKKGFFHLWRKGTRGPVVLVKVSVADFFPKLYAFRKSIGHNRDASDFSQGQSKS
jgi:hypothetical protein